MKLKTLYTNLKNISNFKEKRRMFPCLDKYILKSDASIDFEYKEIIKNPNFGNDIDRILIIIVHDFLQNMNLFNDYEVKLISILLKLRRGKSSILFSHFYPVMKHEVLNYKSIDRQSEIENIENIFKTSGKASSPEPVKFDYSSNSSPHFKYENVCNYASPTSDQRYSYSDDMADIPFHYTNCASPSSSINVSLFKAPSIFSLPDNVFNIGGVI